MGHRWRPSHRCDERLTVTTISIWEGYAAREPELAIERTSSMKRSKNYRAVAEKIDDSKLYEPGEALDFAKANATAKFDETVDVSLRLGVDPRKADQMVRGTVNLPNGT